MPNFTVHFANGDQVKVEARDGTTAKSLAREKQGWFKDEETAKRAGKGPDRVSLITRVEHEDDAAGRV